METIKSTLKSVIQQLQDWSKKYLSDEAQLEEKVAAEAPVKLFDIVDDESLKYVQEQLKWNHHDWQAEKINVEYGKISKWVLSENKILPKNDEESPFTHNGQQYYVKMIDLLQDVLQLADSGGENDGQTKEQLWRDDDPDYMSLSEAVSKLGDSKIPLSTLSKQLTPSGPMRYMRKGQRCKVHIGDFRRHIKSKYPGADVESEVAEGYLADVEARKKTEQRRKQTNNQ
jgi:hypothetical protein